MAKLPLKDSNNKDLNALEGSEKVFNERPRKHAVAELVRLQRASKRRGTSGAKTRSFVSRSSAKPFAQKGTGRARQGDVRAPNLEGGGVAFPPHPRDYRFDLNKKTRKVALRSILSDKVKNDQLFVLQDHGVKEIKSKSVADLMSRLGLKKALVVLAEKDEVFEKSVRNLSQYKALRVEGLNAYDMLFYDQVVVMAGALPLIEKRLA